MTDTTSIIDAPNESGNTSEVVIADAINRLQSGQATVYSTVVGDDFATKAAVLNAVTNATPIRDHLGQTIMLENIVVQPVELTDPKSGEVTTAPRVILLDNAGNAYYGISPVLLKSIETFTGVLGHPSTWPEAVGIVITEERSNGGYKFYNMKLAPAPARKK